jgi:uncharacterized delta-60 repeat protein
MKRTLTLFAACAPFALFAQGAGSLDPSFNPGTGANDRIHAMALQPDGKILVGGHFTEYNGTAISGIARVLPDGSIDAAFDPGTGVTGPTPGFSSWVNAIVVQPDGRILIAGNFTSLDGQAAVRVARLNADGSPDPSFDAGSGPNQTVYAMALQADGKILVGGSLTSIDGTPTGRIARLEPDGSLDNTFVQGDGFNQEVFSLVVLPNGNIMAGGVFATYNGAEVKPVVRLGPNGTLDQSFAPMDVVTSSSGVQCMALQPDGKMLLGGSFSDADFQDWAPIIRVEENGALDQAFAWNGGSMFTYSVQTIALQADGKILVGGNFFSGTATRFARLAPNGAMDEVFNANTGSSVTSLQNRVPYALLVQPDGHILLGGNFIEYAGVARSRVARVFGSNVTSVAEVQAPQPVQLWPNPASDLLHLSERRSGRMLDAQGRVVLQFGMEDVFDVRGFSPGLYSIAFEQGGVQRFVVH